MKANKNHIYNFISNLVMSLSKPQKKVLAMIVSAIIFTKTLILSELAMSLRQETTFSARLKRIWRFVSNRLIKPNEVLNEISSFVLNNFDKKICEVVVDITYVGKFIFIFCGIPVKKRLLPIYYHCIRKKNFQKREEIKKFFKRLKGFLIKKDFAPATRMMIIADRGFASCEMFSFLKDELGFEYVIRARKDVKIEVGDWERLENIQIDRGTTKIIENVYYCQSKRIKVNIIISRNGGALPIYIVTSLPASEEILDLYAKRMWIEEGFKDLKDKLRLSKIRIKKLEHLRRFMLAVIITYIVCFLLGDTAKKRGYEKLVGFLNQLSLFNIGIRLIRFKPEILEWLVKTEFYHILEED